MLNYIWLALVVLAVVIGGWRGALNEVTEAAFTAAKSSVMSIALPLVGITALWLGMMRLAERAGVVGVLARWLRPLLRRLFPDVPKDHPALGSMLMNMAANMIGLSNAATPLGLRAMQDLEKLNPRPGTATNAMCTFLAINTGSIQLLPTTAIGLLAAGGSANPSAIVATSLIASVCTTSVGIVAAKLLERTPWFRLPPSEATDGTVPGPTANSAPAGSAPTEKPEASGATAATMPAWGWLVLAAFVFGLGWAFVQRFHAPTVNPAEAHGWLRAMNALSVIAVPAFLAFFPLYAALVRVRVYEEFVEGAKDGFQVAVRIIPFLVAMLVAIGMFRAAGGVDMVAAALRPVLDLIRFPTELLPLAMTRPLSGSATIGLFADLVKTYGPDSLLARTGGTILGSTETTFYVLAVYFGAVAVRRTRHAVAVGLLADLTGIIVSVALCRMVFR